MGNIYCHGNVIIDFEVQISGIIMTLWKESLNSDGQQSITISKMDNNLSPQIIEHKNITTYDIGNPDLVLEQAHKLFFM